MRSSRGRAFVQRSVPFATRRFLRRARAAAWAAALAALPGWASPARAQDTLEELVREVRELKARVAALERANAAMSRQIDVERLVVRRELIVSDTGDPWEKGYEREQIPRGLYVRSLWDGSNGTWVRSRLIKCEVDDPFDDRFHSVERNGSLRLTPGHISWCVWLGDAWRQMAILQGEGLDPSEFPLSKWDGTTHPGRIRLQSYRPAHDQPLTDAIIGQGRMALGGGGYGGGGLPYPTEVLELWGGDLRPVAVAAPEAPRVLRHDGSGARRYAVIAVGPQGRRSAPSPGVRADGLAELQWDSVPGADAYVVVRDGLEVTVPTRSEGSRKQWADPGLPKRPAG